MRPISWPATVAGSARGTCRPPGSAWASRRRRRVRWRRRRGGRRRSRARSCGAARSRTPLARRPVVLHAYPSAEQAVALAAESARVHLPVRRSCSMRCRLLAAMLHAALPARRATRMLEPARCAVRRAPAPRPCREHRGAAPYGADWTPPPADGGVLAVLDLARWCLASTANFRDGALRAVNLGGDSDVIAAVYGQLAGAHYGVSTIPAPLAPGAGARRPHQRTQRQVAPQCAGALGEEAPGP